EAFENAIRVLHAISGSTNAILHLVAYAGRVGVELPLGLFDELCATTPWLVNPKPAGEFPMEDVFYLRALPLALFAARCAPTPWLVNLKPSGEFLMEDFFYAGGLPAVMTEIADLLHLDAVTVTGRTVGENIAAGAIQNTAVIRPAADPLDAGGSLVVLYGSLCPDGAVMKIVAAEAHLLQHEGRALVFGDIPDLAARGDDPELECDETTVMVLRNAGPIGGPGMPEWGHLPIPHKLRKAGLTDLVRISDARMSGTSYGAVVLHVAPESAVGGPLALVQDGDLIRLDVEEGGLHLLGGEAEPARG